MRVPSYREYLNENVYVETNDTIPSLIEKLMSEGKSQETIYTYLYTLGVDSERAHGYVSAAFAQAQVGIDPTNEY